MRYFHKIFAVFGVFQWFVIINGLSFTLDKTPANNHMWKVTGDLTYFASGSKLLGPASAFLPDDFDYTSMIHTQGIWGLSPKSNFLCDSNSEKWMWSSEEDNNVTENDLFDIDLTTDTPSPTTNKSPHCDISATGRFLFFSVAKSLLSVTIRYDFGGNATLRVTGSEGHSTQMNANYNKMDGWNDFKVPVDGNRMLLEVIVNKNGDYILIDSITVETLDVTTTSTFRPSNSDPDPVSSTTTPVPQLDCVNATEHKTPLTSKRTFSLDVAPSRNDSMWTLTGDLTYLESGSKLIGPTAQFLPMDFSFTSMYQTNGIWSVLPNDNFKCDRPGTYRWSSEETSYTSNNVCNPSATAAITFKSRLRRLSLVTVWYNFGGNATMHITDESKYPIMINAKYIRSEGWSTLSVPVTGQKVTLEATITGMGDFILIDRIAVETVELGNRASPQQNIANRTSSAYPPTPPTPSVALTTEHSVTKTHAPDTTTTVEPSGRNKIVTTFQFGNVKGELSISQVEN